MSHFDIVKELNDVRLDGPSQNAMSSLRSLQRRPSETRVGCSPSRQKFITPGKSTNITPGRKAKTPGGDGPRSAKKTNRTPGAKTPGPDRFIPSRATTNMEYAHYALTNPDGKEDEHADTEYSKQLAAAMNCERSSQILNFKIKAPEAARSDGSNLRVLYNTGKCASKATASTRHIPVKPERILDAPGLIDDYYLNLLEWSPNNILCVALGAAVYLWNAETASIEQLLELTNPDEYVCSVSWVQEGGVLAVGLSTGAVQLWDTEQQKMLRSMSGHATRVGCLSWNKYVLSSGSKSGAIHHHDVRVAEHCIARLQNHTQEVCGLKWSPSGRYLASGGNDNLVNVWCSPLGSSASTNLSTPLHTFSQHRAGIKALAWCPWQPNLLATGGGSADRQILMWNVQSGANLRTTPTDSQVCALLWSKEHKELISGHGYATNHLRIWKYPTMDKVADLSGHSARILAMTMSPDGTTVASAAGDETVRLWKCFDVDKVAKKAAAKSKPTGSTISGLAQCLR